MTNAIKSMLVTTVLGTQRILSNKSIKTIKPEIRNNSSILCTLCIALCKHAVEQGLLFCEPWVRWDSEIKQINNATYFPNK